MDELLDEAESMVTQPPSDDTSNRNGGELGRLLMDGKIVGALDDEGVMRYKLTPEGRRAAEAEMANCKNGKYVDVLQ